MTKQKTNTTFDTATFHLRKRESSTLRQQISRLIKEKNTGKSEDAPLDPLEIDFMR